jgi:Ca-activated chloride channel family protein
MRFLWPSALILLALIPLLAGLYWWLLQRRRRTALRYSSLALIREALPGQSAWRRRLPPALLLLALAGLTLSLARPMWVTIVPAGRATIVLTLDVSRSMRQRDIAPSRLDAAKAAALSFAERQPSSTQIGVVAFAGFAQLVQPPTNDAERIEEAIISLTTGRGTAIGSGILSAVDTIAEINPDVAPSSGYGAAGPEITPVPEGQYVPDIIVLLTDGVYTSGPDPVEAAHQAVERGIRVYTIGFGTNLGNAAPQGDGYFGWGGFRHGIDEESLKAIAAMTGGEYYSASSAGELQKVFESLPSYMITREETTEVSVIFAALGALLAAAAVLLAQLWRPLP